MLEVETRNHFIIYNALLIGFEKSDLAMVKSDQLGVESGFRPFFYSKQL